MRSTIFKNFRRSRPPAATATAAPTAATLPTVPTPITAPARSNDRPQNLGSDLAGNIEIRCKLEGVRSSPWEPKWCVSTASSELQGALYFELQFISRDIPLEFAKVRIKLGQPANGEPIPIVNHYAPSNGISGPPIAHTTAKHNNTNPQFGLNTPFGGGSGSVGEWGRNEGSNPYRSWVFSSGTPRVPSSTDVTDVEFTWRAGWGDDYDAIDRKFRTAVVIMREKPERVSMYVQVEAKTPKGWQAGPPQGQRSDWLEPTKYTDETDFQRLLDTLETDITNAIVGMTPTVLKSKSAAITEQTPMNAQQISAPQNAGLITAPGLPMPQSLPGTAVLLLPPAVQAPAPQPSQPTIGTVTV